MESDARWRCGRSRGETEAGRSEKRHQRAAILRDQCLNRLRQNPDRPEQRSKSLIRLRAAELGAVALVRGLGLGHRARRIMGRVVHSCAMHRTVGHVAGGGCSPLATRSRGHENQRRNLPHQANCRQNASTSAKSAHSNKSIAFGGASEEKAESAASALRSATQWRFQELAVPGSPR